MFGTFASEWDHDEKVKYGLVSNIRNFDPNHIQWGYYKFILGKAWNTPGILSKLNVLLKGPGYNERLVYVDP